MKIKGLKIINKIGKYLGNWHKHYLNLIMIKIIKSNILNQPILIPNKKNKKINFFIKYQPFYKLHSKININKNGLLKIWENLDLLMVALDSKKEKIKEVNFFLKVFKWKNKTNKYSKLYIKILTQEVWAEKIHFEKIKIF